METRAVRDTLPTFPTGAAERGLALQYTATPIQRRFHNYDGAGRNASDNNTTYLLVRFIF